MHTEFCWNALLRGTHFEDRIGDGKITKIILGRGSEEERWMELTHDHVKLRSLVSVELSLRIVL
jgi:hypothetical protein